jgi:CelD/BcsL family acetyltransferase involved in cellulose biosynthesis
MTMAHQKPALSMAAPVTEIITDTAGFRELREEWTELLRCSGCSCLFLTWEWMFTWWQHLGGSRRRHLITVRQDGLLIAIAPLALCPPRLKRLKPFQALEFLAAGSVGSDYLSFLVRRGYEEAALAQLSISLTGTAVMLELARVDATSFVMVALALELKQAGWQPMRVSTNFSPCLDLQGHTWESYCNGLNHSHRRDLKKRLAALHKAFEVRFELVASESQRAEMMAAFIQLHLRRWSAQGGSDALGGEDLQDFHRALSAMLFERGWLRLYTLWLDGKPAAIIYLFKHEGVFYYYQTSFDLEYGKYGIGTLILAMAIKAAIAEGALEFDFLHDDEPYKYLWAKEERELIRLDLFPPGYHGAAGRNAAIFKSGLKRMLAEFRDKPQ